MPITCAPNDLESSAKCYNCLDPGLRDAIIIYLLCQVAGMTCTPQSLMNSAACYVCIPKGKRDAVMIYLLCQIAAGGTGGAQCGTVDPTTPPTGNCQLYVNTAAGGLWYWDSNSAAWIQLIK